MINEQTKYGHQQCPICVSCARRPHLIGSPRRVLAVRVVGLVKVLRSRESGFLGLLMMMVMVLVGCGIVIGADGSLILGLLVMLGRLMERLVDVVLRLLVRTLLGLLLLEKFLFLLQEREIDEDARINVVGTKFMV